MPETRYARSGDVHIAYQVTSDGPIDVVIVPGFISNVELDWEDPVRTYIFERLGRLGRVIRFDKRNTGLSDRVSGATLEQRADDLRAVMDAAQSQRAVLYTWSEGGPIAAMFAATHPERTSALIISGGFARFRRSDDYPCGLPDRVFEHFVESLADGWGKGTMALVMMGHGVADAHLVAQMARVERMSASPGAAVETARMNGHIDVRAALPAIQAPTLIMHSPTDAAIKFGNGRYLADNISGARFVELRRAAHLPESIADADEELDEIEEFLTGARPLHEPERVLATVLFVDIVGSTERAALLGDRAWRAALEDFLGRAQSSVARHRGQFIKDTGDGFLATFDGPGRAVRCADVVHAASAAVGLDLRCGLHTGEVELAADDVRGIAVHIGARIAALGDAGDVLVSSTVRDLVVGSDLTFAPRGEHELKGLPGPWSVHALIR